VRNVSYLQSADLLEKELSSFTDSDGPTDDVTAQWSPNGKTVAFARRYTDERWTQGYQIYLRDIDSDQLITVVYDKRYTTSNFHWNSTGTRLVMQRFPLGVANARPEIWVYDLETDTLNEVLSDAFLPRWASP
jgi:Tol biopolymer transport system component